MSTHDDLQAGFRKVLRKHRKALGMIQDAVTSLLGMSRLQYYQVETGSRQLQFKGIVSLCELLAIELEELLGDFAPA